MVGKDGNTTDLTVGRYAGLITFVRHDGVVSKELAIYNAGLTLGADPYLPGRHIVSFLRVFKQFACNIPRG